MQPPCKDCKDRWVKDHKTCHSTCEKYLAYAQSRKELLAAKSEYYRQNYDMWLTQGRGKSMKK